VSGTHPAWFGLHNSSGVGYVKTSVFLFGLAILCIGGCLSLTATWRHKPLSIIADVGLRLVATGYLLGVCSGLADLLGFGDEHYPKLPSLGHFQELGVEICEVIIALGFLLIIPYERHHRGGTGYIC
jgi:hypothetical protein